MRVLHVTQYFAPAFGFGGPPRSILALCHAQQAAGMSVEVITTTANVGDALPAAPDGVIYDGVPTRYLAASQLGPLIWAPGFERVLAQAAQSADVIHAHGLFNAQTWAARSAAAATARPLVVSVRGMLEPSARAHHATRKDLSWLLFDRRVCDEAALLHTTSAIETASVRRALPRKRVVEIPNAIDRTPAVPPERRVQVRAQLQISGDAPIVLFLGRLHPIKRLDLVAESFALLAGRHDAAILVIAGDGDPAIRSATEHALRHLAARVRWTGAVDDATRDALLAEAAALVMCSDSENFGMSVAEALAAGVVPVVTRTCPWQLLDVEGAGYWVDQSAAAIADALERVLCDPERTAVMSGNARRLASTHFALDVIGRKWAAAYTSVLQPTSASAQAR